MSHGFLESEHKRRINPATSDTMNGDSNSSPVSFKSLPFNSSNIVPNTSHITQNSSLASSGTLSSATSTVMHDVQLKCKLPFCRIIIQSHPNRQIPPSESNLKCVEDYIRLRASQIEGFHAKSFNISKFNEDYKNHQCFVKFATTVEAKQASEIFNNIRIHDCQLRCKYSEPVKDKNEINPATVRSYNTIQNIFMINVSAFKLPLRNARTVQ